MSDISSKGNGNLGKMDSTTSGQVYDSQDEVILERYLANCDPYRSTTLLNPWPYPLALEYAPHLEHELVPLNEEIRNILNIHGFPNDVGISPFMATKPQYPGGDIPINILHVILRGEDHTLTQFSAAKDDLLQLLRRREVMNIEVEIVNIDKCFSPSIFPLSSHHPIVAAFEESKNHIIEILDDCLASKWNVLCPFATGRSEQKARPAIVVNVNPLTRANWSNVGTEIQEIISSHFQGPPVEVEFLPGCLSMIQSQQVSFIDRMDPDGLPRMGHSIGIVGERNAGTLGGYFTLTQNGKVHKGLLTNYHVVRRSSLETEESLDRFGCSLSRPPMQTIEMESLAIVDKESTMNDIDQKLEVMNQQIDDISTEIETRKQVGARPQPMLQKTAENCEVAISDLHRKCQILQKMPHFMGKVAAASGKAILERRLMDWAFIQLTDTAAENFFGPNLMIPVPPDQMPHLYDPNMGLPAADGIPLTEFGRLEKDQYYVKLGRSTGVTAGVCHGALACCNWKGKNRTRYQHDGQQIELSSDITEAFVIINKKLREAEHQQSSFAEDGDSGSLIINIKGKVCGLLYGATTGLSAPGISHFYANAGLAIDFSDLSSSIKLRTMTKDGDGKLVEPPAEIGLPDSS